MQLAYIALVTKDGVTRFIFTIHQYQAHIFETREDAQACLAAMPAHLKFRDGTKFDLSNLCLETVREGWVIACTGPFDFTEAQMLEAIQS